MLPLFFNLAFSFAKIKLDFFVNSNILKLSKNGSITFKFCSILAELYAPYINSV